MSETTDLLRGLGRVGTLRTQAETLPPLSSLINDDRLASTVGTGLGHQRLNRAAAVGPALGSLPVAHDGR